MRADVLEQVTFTGQSAVPAVPPTLYEFVAFRKRTTASRVLPPRAFIVSHGGRGAAAGQPGGH